MGTGNRMYQNISNVARQLLLFQVTSKQHERDNVTIYPMMDGIYAVSEEESDIVLFLEEVFKDMAEEVVNSNDIAIVRGGVSFGPIVEGKDFNIDSYDDSYQRNINSLLIGPPMVEAYGIEGDAPPFGVAVHESARAFTPKNFEYKWHKWFDPTHRELANDVRKELDEYFNRAESMSHVSNYPKEKIEQHRDMMRTYLPEVKLKNKE